jgi:hypothetical protein
LPFLLSTFTFLPHRFPWYFLVHHRGLVNERGHTVAACFMSSAWAFKKFEIPNAIALLRPPELKLLCSFIFHLFAPLKYCQFFYDTAATPASLILTDVGQ